MSDQVSIEMSGTTNNKPIAEPRSSFAGKISELDEDGVDNRPEAGDSPFGVDSGLLENNKPDNKNTGSSNGRIPKPFDIDANGPRTIMVDGVETPVPDLNAYQHKKTFAQGMMDLALLSANANQLRYVIESYTRHPFFYPSVILICFSILAQVAVGIGLIMNSRYNVGDPAERCRANRISNMTIIGIFVITVVNVFVSAFGVADAPS